MNDAGPADEQRDTPPDDTDPQRTITPFIVAAAVAALLLGGVLLAGFLAPAEKNVTEADRIAGAVYEFADASSRYGLEPPEPAVCTGFDPSRSPLAGRLKPDTTGADVGITILDEVQVRERTATITVTSKVDGTDATATWHLTRSGSDWLVCSTPAP